MDRVRYESDVAGNRANTGNKPRKQDFGLGYLTCRCGGHNDVGRFDIDFARRFIVRTQGTAQRKRYRDGLSDGKYKEKEGAQWQFHGRVAKVDYY